MKLSALIHLVLALVLAPLLPGLIARVKALFAGRQGRPLLQVYFDLAKLLGKGAVYSRTTTWVFRAGPIFVLAAVLTALTLIPLGGQAALVSFPGDFVLAAYLLGLGRLAMVLAALDTGSSFEGMGACREASFSALAEPALFLCFLVLAHHADSLTLTGMLGRGLAGAARVSQPELALVPFALFLLLLAENARIPVDDPNTHLELTMIHEVMILDHSGPDLAFLVYASCLKLWLFCVLCVETLVPTIPGQPWLNAVCALGAVFAAALVVGVVESCMARVRLFRVSKFLAAAGGCAAMSLILTLWR